MTKILTGPLINFNGAFVIDSLQVGHIQIQCQRVLAIRVILWQTMRYPVVAHGQNAAEIYAACWHGHTVGKNKLEAYSPCHLIKNERDGNMIPVVSRITWYLSAEGMAQCKKQAEIILTGDLPGDALYPAFEGHPFAVFASEK